MHHEPNAGLFAAMAVVGGDSFPSPKEGLLSLFLAFGTR